MEEIRKLTEEDFVKTASDLDIEVEAVKAVQEVETGGRGGFFAPGKPAILFEGHVFWSQLKKLEVEPKINPEAYTRECEDILYPKWERGHYKGGIKEYDRLERACKLGEFHGMEMSLWEKVEAAALASASWGMFQIMGFNYGLCGFKSVKGFVEAMKESEGKQLDAFAAYVSKRGLTPLLRSKDWAGFAAKYNGPGYAQNKYDVKMAEAYRKYKGGARS